jgi:CDP-diglyceride synthetase
MLKRTITGACYVAILAVTFLLREFVDYRLFHLLTYAFLIMGTYELQRMLKPFTERYVGIAAIACVAAALPAYLIAEYFILKGMGFAGYALIVGLLVCAECVYSIIKNTDLKQFGINVLHYLYPSVCLLFMVAANELGDNGFIALLTAFVISPLSDTAAYFTGMAIGGKKLCPKISPKKTWAGAIGGTIGGILGAIAVYFIFTPTVNFFSPILLFILVGLFGSVLTLFGDLFESYIKRRVGLKDMGKILPGHGGVMDRIDGTLFATVFLLFVFMVV